MSDAGGWPRSDAPGISGVAFRLVGTFRVAVDGSAVEQVGSAKARRLLALLVVERGHNVSIDRIAAALWESTPPERAAENVATLVSRLRRVLGPGVVHGARGSYRLGDGAGIWVDLDAAEDLATRAEGSIRTEPAVALAASRRALDLIGGGELVENEPDAEWTYLPRLQLSRLLRRVRRLYAEAALDVGEFDAAQDIAEQALTTDPLDEAAGRALMRALHHRGEPAAALAVFDRLRRVLDGELGSTPAPETRAIHLAILQERSPTAERTTAPANRPGQDESSLLARDLPEADLVGRDLLGREAEFGRLRAAWAQAAASHPELIILTGEAGIGKTRLIDELGTVAASTGGLVLRARCYETERSLFLQPVVEAIGGQVVRMAPRELRDVVGERAGVLAELVPDVGAMLGTVPGERGDPDTERRRAYDAVTIFLRRLALRHPVLLLIDDLHHTGLAVIELLHYVRRQLADSRLLITVAVRSEEGQRVLADLADVGTLVEIGPLPAEAVLQLAVSAGHGDQADAVAKRSAGHPLYAVEMLRGLTVGEQLPASLQEAVLARVHRTGRESERILRAAAVLGTSFDPVTIARLLDLPAAQAVQQCEDLLRTRLVVVAERAYEFVHDLVREVLYASTPLPTRLAYHARAADLLGETPEAMAGHAAAIDDWSRAARGWLRAADQAMNRFAAADAERLLDRAIEAATRAGDPELLGRAHLARGRVRETLARYADAVADQERSVELARSCGDPRLEMLALRELGGDAAVATVGGAGRSSPTVSLERLESGLRLADSLGDRGMQADFLARMAVLMSNRLRFTNSLDAAARAVAVARGSGDPVALAKALDGAKTGFAYLGMLPELETTLSELEPLLRAQGDLWRLQWTVFESSFPFIADARWPDAVAQVEAALALNRRSGYVGYESWLTAHLGWLARLQGNDRDAVGHGRRAITTEPSALHSWFITTAAAMLSTTLMEMGDRAQAMSVLRDVPFGGTVSQTEAYRLRYLAALAEATGSADVLAEADRLLTAIQAPARGAWLLGSDAYLGVARAWLAAGRPDLAADRVAPLVVAADKQHWIPVLAQGLLVAGECEMITHGESVGRESLNRATALAAQHGMGGVGRRAQQLLARLSTG